MELFLIFKKIELRGDVHIFHMNYTQNLKY